MSSNDIWKIPPDTIPTYLDMKCGTEIRKAWSEVVCFADSSLLDALLHDELLKLMTERARIVLRQVGSTQTVGIEFKNMREVVRARFCR